LNRILEKPVVEVPKVETEELKPIVGTRFMPFRVRKQILEAESRRQAQLIKERESTVKSTEELEKEVIGDAVQSSNG
jgi:hypothetical protein